MIEFSTTSEQARSVSKTTMKIFTGTVISKKMEKTATVAVSRVITHPVYKKRVRLTKKYQVHDETESSEIGQVVKFAASKPYSKTKRWKIVNVKEESAKKEAPSKSKVQEKKGGKK